MSDITISQPIEKQYYQFTKSSSFGSNAIFEKNGDTFSPVVGNWTEDDFKKLSGGKGFKDVVKLDSSLDEVLSANPVYKQDGVVLPKGQNYEIYGRTKAEYYDTISDAFSKIKPQKKFKFVFKNDFTTGVGGDKLALTSETDPNYKKYMEENKAAKISGSFSEHNDYNEVRINPDLPTDTIKYIILHEIAHSYFLNKKIPDNLFNQNKTYSSSGGENLLDWANSKERNINKQENIADHFSDYILYPNEYQKFYPNEYSYFNNLLKE